MILCVFRIKCGEMWGYIGRGGSHDVVLLLGFVSGEGPCKFVLASLMEIGKPTYMKPMSGNCRFLEVALKGRRYFARIG